jgi:tryptophan synthase alpha chain
MTRENRLKKKTYETLIGHHRVENKLNRLFQTAKANRQPLFLPYVCLGYPSYQGSLETAKAALRGGAAALELGVPFSDPIADGPTLQKATHWALDKGTKFADVFRLIRDIRKAGFQQPLLVMTYLNLVEQFGKEKFVATLVESGGDGAIIPDLPLEQFAVLQGLLGRQNLALIPFIAPTSSPPRVQIADSQGAPFLYYVSVTGVTGARKSLAPGLVSALGRLRQKLKTPIVVGFGISTPAQAARVGKAADGIIIASALVQLVSRTKTALIGSAVEGFCRKVVKALKGVNSKF